jgi:predicted RNA-binding Zn ribbon-like protein
MTDLHARLLAAIDEFDENVYQSGAIPAALRAVVELCDQHMADAVDGSRVAVETMWPPDILRTIAESLGVTP